MRVLLALAAAAIAGCGGNGGGGGDAPPEPPVASAPCAEGSPEQVLTGTVAEADAKTYRMLPFTVAEGAARIEVDYAWAENPGPPGTPAASTTLDLGIWDARGYRDQAAFRGWGGSRMGRSADEPIFLEEDVAALSFRPGPMLAGQWHVELGIAAVSLQGASYTVRIRQCGEPAGAAPRSQPVNPLHVASTQAGWYHGDFHMHGRHSNPKAPSWDEFVAMAREARLDFLMVTDYVTGWHWDELGPVQRANPDLVIWPGREVITYSGHVNVHGETPGFYEYRHGFEDIDIAQVQQAAVGRGALFQINHPTLFPPPAFSSFCRGCYFELGDRIDWDAVDTLEILTGPVIANAEDVGLSGPGEIENPFLQTAIDLWDEQLNAGHRITAVSGSDSKGVEADDAARERSGYGSSATAVHSRNLSRPALDEAIRAGRAYVRTRGVARSPALEFTASAGDAEAMFGGSLPIAFGEAATLRTVVTGGSGQLLSYFRNGELFVAVPVTADPFEHELPALRTPDEGPLGTAWRIEVRDTRSRTAIGNPIFLSAP